MEEVKFTIHELLGKIYYYSGEEKELYDIRLMTKAFLSGTLKYKPFPEKPKSLSDLSIEGIGYHSRVLECIDHLDMYFIEDTLELIPKDENGNSLYSVVIESLTPRGYSCEAVNHRGDKIIGANMVFESARMAALYAVICTIDDYGVK